MTDALLLLLVLAFFAGAWQLVRALDRPDYHSSDRPATR